MINSVKHRANLPVSEQLVLWGIRHWAAGFPLGTFRHELLRDAFRLARAPGAALALDAFLTIVFSARESTIDIRPPAASSVTDHEALLLSVVAHSQIQGGLKDASELLATWLPPAGRRIALPHCVDFAGHLIGGGHLLRPWRSTETETETEAWVGTNLSPSTLVLLN